MTKYCNTLLNIYSNLVLKRYSNARLTHTQTTTLITRFKAVTWGVCLISFIIPKRNTSQRGIIISGYIHAITTPCL